MKGLYLTLARFDDLRAIAAAPPAVETIESFSHLFNKVPQSSAAVA
jgi:hypothetical protein